MPATTYIVIDHEEKRTVRGRHEYLGGFLRALAANPITIDEFDRVYQELTDEPFFTEGNRPKVPQELSLDTIRTVLGTEGKDPDEVMVHWKQVSHHRDPNYESDHPDQRTDFDIPEPDMVEINQKSDTPTTDPMDIELGYSLIELVDTSRGGDLLERTNMIRTQVLHELYLMLPPVRFRDNMQLAPNEYKIKVNGKEVARGQAEADKLLAMDSGLVGDLKVEGIKTTEPAFGCPAVWINKDQKDSAEARGYTVVTASAVVATHIDKIVHEHKNEIWTDGDKKPEIEDGIIEADLRTKKLRYITYKGFEIKNSLIPDWTVVAQ